jgi:acyl-CoA synthetase (AMP-forming)/AMP-acid ligase II
MFYAQLAGSEPPLSFLRTGDLAFFQNDKLFICGRIKDLIILNGVNYYPQDIEAAAQDASQAVRPGCVAAFSFNESSGNGRLEVVFEIRHSSNKKAAAEVIQAVQSQISQKIGLVPCRVVAIKERSICKTTISGKIQCQATRSALHSVAI